MKSYDNYFVPINDLDRAKRYYQETLGLELKFDFADKGMMAFKIGDEEPALILKDVNKYPDAKSTVWFVVDDVTKEYEKMKAKGVFFRGEPYEIGTGHAVEFEDPFGNRFGITDYIK